MRLLRTLGLVLFGLVCGLTLVLVYGAKVAAQAPWQDLTRLQASSLTYGAAGGYVKMRFVKDTKTSTCYAIVIGGSDGNTGTALTQAPNAACD